jgi:hypothetical protein
MNDGDCERVPPSCLSGVPVSLWDRTQALCRGVVLLLDHHGCPAMVIAEACKQLHAYLDALPDESSWEKCAKYVFVEPMSIYLRNKRPPAPPAGGIRWNGHVWGWFRPRFNAFCRRNTHLWYSWFQLKRCALVPSDSLILKSYQDHRAILTSLDVGEDATIAAILKNKHVEKILNILAKKIGKDVNRVAYDPLGTDRPCQLPLDNLTPSRSACFEQSRKKGGCHQVVVEAVVNQSRRQDQRFHLTSPWLPAPPVSEETVLAHLATFEQVTMYADDLVCDDGEHSPIIRSRDHLCAAGHFSKVDGCKDCDDWVSSEFCDQPIDEKVMVFQPRDLLRMTDSWRVDRAGKVLCVVSTYCHPLISGSWDRHTIGMAIERSSWFHLGATSRLNATIQVVLEPLKRRVISKGPALEYFAMKPLQKILHGHLRKMSCFKSLDRPFCATDLMSMYHGSGDSGDPSESVLDGVWCSVDYTSATDKLSYKYSKAIMERLLRDVPVLIRERAMRVLGLHQLDYPTVTVDGKKEQVPKGDMKTGQLMGSILSFPILCLANLFVYLELEWSRLDSCTLQQALASVQVNGDDMIYRSRPGASERHADFAKRVGLDLSPGKTNEHAVYCNMNSKAFHYDVATPGSTPVHIAYLPCGLMFGMHKVSGGTETAAAHVMGAGLTVSSCANICVQGSLPGKQVEILKKYISLHQEELADESAGECVGPLGFTVFSRNLFIPESVGGLGIVPPADWYFNVSKIQRFVAAGLLVHEKYRSSQAPHPGRVYTPPETRKQMPYEQLQEPSDYGKFAFGRLEHGESAPRGLGKRKCPRELIFTGQTILVTSCAGEIKPSLPDLERESPDITSCAERTWYPAC